MKGSATNCAGISVTSPAERTGISVSLVGLRSARLGPEKMPMDQIEAFFCVCRRIPDSISTGNERLISSVWEREEPGPHTDSAPSLRRSLQCTLKTSAAKDRVRNAFGSFADNKNNPQSISAGSLQAQNRIRLRLRSSPNVQHEEWSRPRLPSS